MISKLHLSPDLYKDFILAEKKNSLQRLGKINVFIGQNNSGKSRFLRTLFSDDSYEFELMKFDLSKVRKSLRHFMQDIRSSFDALSINDADSVFQRLSQAEQKTGNFNVGNVKGTVVHLRKIATDFIDKRTFGSWSHSAQVISGPAPYSVIPKVNLIGHSLQQLLDETLPEDFDYPLHKVYVPILRGLRPMQYHGSEFTTAETEDNFKRRTIRDYFPKQKEEKIQKEIFTGFSLYTDTKKMLLGNKEGRDKIKKFEEFLSQAFFDNEEVTLIPDINNDVLLIGIGNEERPVYELGDGIQAIIVLLYPLFFNQGKNMLIFLEEPENNMHPGLQRLFIETLVSPRFESFQYFITTHSNHFLDLTLDLDQISVYTFHKNKEERTYKIESASNADIKVLDLIGARSSSVFLSNCTIWVEGITDRFYLKRYLELYQEHLVASGGCKSPYKEDFHYSFVEYGGGNIVHWSFTDEEALEKIKASKISSKIFVVADKDNTDAKIDSAKAKRLKDLKEKLGERCHVVEGREIENTLDGSVVIATVKEMEGKNAEAIKYDEAAIVYKLYKGESMGTFIEDAFKGVKRKYAAKSGTILPKVEFCRTAVKQMNRYDDLSAEGNKIAKALFDFVAGANG